MENYTMDPKKLMNSSNSLEKTLYYEKYVNETMLDKNLFLTDFSEEYEFNSDNVYFPLICYKVPIKDLVISGDLTNNEIYNDLLIDDDHIKMFLHPELENREELSYIDNLKQYEKLPYETVSSTSSMRTVLVKGKEYCIKLHCPIKIALSYRGIGQKQIEHVMKVSNELMSISHPKFAIFPEKLGVNFSRKNNQRSWGYIGRRMVPYPYLKENESYVLTPVFALYSGYRHYPNKKPYIMTLIEKSSLTPLEFVLQEVMFPIMEFWVYAFRTFGFLMEPHGQNLLMEIENDEKIHRLVHRDLDPMIHIPTRQKVGLSLDGFSKDMLFDNSTGQKPFGSIFSVRYDYGICLLVFDCLEKMMNTYYNIKPEQLHEPVKKHFVKLLPDYQEYFPKYVYKLGNADPKTHRSAYYTDNEYPNWRP